MVKPKILFILHLPPPVHGAAMVGQYIAQSQLINSNFDSSILNLQTSACLAECGKGLLSKIWIFLRLYLKVITNLWGKRYDLCYLSINAKGPAFYKEMIVVLIVKLFGCPIVYHYHNKGVSEHQKNWLSNLLYRLQFSNSRTILLSRRLYSDVAKYIRPEQVYYCPNGIPDANSDRPIEFLHNKRIEKNAREVLFVSNLMKSKGVLVLLEAFKILHTKAVPFHAVLIGAPMDIDQKELETFLQKNGLSEKVQYVGKKYGAEKSEYFERAELFVFPTLNDVFGLVNLEAMQYGLSIISTDEGAIPEIVIDGFNGYILAKNDPLALAEKIEFLLERPDLRLIMGQKGRERFLQKYSYQKFEKTFVQTLMKILEDIRSSEKTASLSHDNRKLKKVQL